MDKSKQMVFKKKIDLAFEEKKKNLPGNSLLKSLINSSMSSRLIPMGRMKDSEEEEGQ